MLKKLKNKIFDFMGSLVGYAGLLGFKYPVRKYRFKVSEGLWRGSRLDAEAIGTLRQEGFRLIVNLCAENDNDAKPAAYYGINTLHISIVDNTPPKMGQMIEFLNAVMDPENQPAYVHCQAGAGRTGVAVACYRILVQNWDVANAVEEAKQFGMAMPSQAEFLKSLHEDWKSGKIMIENGVVVLKK